MLPRFEKWKNRPRHSGRLSGLIVATLLLSLVIFFAACGSDDPNAVGVELVDAEIDALLELLDLEEPSEYRGLSIKDPDIPLLGQEVLYLGQKGGDASSILLEYDLGQVLNETITLDLFTQENIETVNFRLLMLSAYDQGDSNAQGTFPWETWYELYHLDDPVDTSVFPGPDPSIDGLPNLNTNYILEDANLVYLPVPKEPLIDWITTGGTHTFLIKEGDEDPASGEGLTGYSSMDMKHGGTTLEPTTIGSDQLGPSIYVKFTEPDTMLIITPDLDLSTFYLLADAPAAINDGFIMRTGLRSYPVLYFDFSSLPDGIFINRAALSVTNNTDSSWGMLESIVVSELEREFFDSEPDGLTLSNLENSVYPITGMTSLDPSYHDVMEFNVTTYVQRMINLLDEQGNRIEKGLILTPGEDFLPSYNTSTLDPDFYFNKFNFFGSDDPDGRGPRLKITYTVNEAIQGGGK
ncbi:MAG: hypothetical protein KOO60_06015 [Gemmatimonadales bacterium]|nr:hypothetical protein [Gemmatimonadales bacterium]